MTSLTRRCRTLAGLVGVALALLAGALGTGCREAATGPGGTPADTTPARPGERQDLTTGVVASGTVTLAGRTGRFAIRGLQGQRLRLFLQARSGRIEDTLVAAVKDSAGRSCCWQVVSAGTDTSLTARGTDWFSVPPNDPLYVDVSGLRADDAGAFRLMLYAQSSSTEKLGARFAVGDTVSGEAIDVPGDVDNFYFTAAAGEELILFVQSLAASPDPLRFTITDSAGTADVASAQTYSPDATLLGQRTAMFTVPQSGTYRLRIGGSEPFDNWPWVESEVSGPYRFFIARVNRAPERAARVLAPGDTSGIEAIEFPGDIDEFSFSGVAGTEMNVLFQPLAGLTGTMYLELLQAGKGVASGSVKGPTASLEAAATGPLKLPATGDYTIRVHGESSDTGRYRFELYRIDRRPEHTAVPVSIGTTVVGEALERPGDIDEYRLAAQPGRQFAVAFRVLDTPKPPLWLEVLRGDSLVGTPASTDRFNWVGWPYPSVGYTSMITTPDTGSYTLRIFAPRNTFGRYEFEIYPLSTAPETISPTVTLGVPVTGERLDRAMDVDTFMFAGTAGQEINVFLRRDPGYTGQLELLFQGASHTRYGDGWWGYDMSLVSGGSASLDSANAGRLKLPATGLYRIYVSGYSASNSGDPGVGPYSFLLFPIDHRPEGRGAAIAVGDTVREAIYPSGDIDDFTLPVKAGDKLTITLDGDPALMSAYTDVYVYDSAGGIVSRRYKAARWYELDVPTTDTYTVRVWHPDGTSWPVFFPVLMGNYRLIISRRP